MNSWSSAVGSWAADYYFLATVLLIMSLLVTRFLRQPVRRLTVVRVTMVGLIVLAVVCCLPFWPRVRILPPPAAQALANVPAEAAEGPVPLKPVEFYEPPILSVTPEEAFEAPPASAGKADREEAAATQAGVPIITWPHWSEVIGGLFLTGTAIIGLWLVWGGACAASSLCRRAESVPERIALMLSRIVGKAHRTPRLLHSPKVGNGIALGVVRPTILLPSDVISTESWEGLEAALAHEWAHIRNGDLWLLTLRRFLLLLLYAHPLFWLLRRTMRLDQELLADATGAEFSGRDVYAVGLVAWARTTFGTTGYRVYSAMAICEKASLLERRVFPVTGNCDRVQQQSAEAIVRIRHTPLAIGRAEP